MTEEVQQNMKTTVIIALASAALWGAFTFGYHKGIRDNGQMWHSKVHANQFARFASGVAIIQGKYNNCEANSIPSTAVSK
jgi:hypothetical protein